MNSLLVVRLIKMDRTSKTSVSVLLDSGRVDKHTTKLVYGRKVVKSFLFPPGGFNHKLCSRITGRLRSALTAESKEMNEMMCHGPF